MDPLWQLRCWGLKKLKKMVGCVLTRRVIECKSLQRERIGEMGDRLRTGYMCPRDTIFIYKRNKHFSGGGPNFDKTLTKQYFTGGFSSCCQLSIKLKIYIYLQMVHNMGFSFGHGCAIGDDIINLVK